MLRTSTALLFCAALLPAQDPPGNAPPESAGPRLELDLELPFDGSALPPLSDKALRPIAGMAFTGDGRRLALSVRRHDRKEFNPPVEVYGVGAGRALRLNEADEFLIVGSAPEDRVFAIDDDTLIRMKTIGMWMRQECYYRGFEEREAASGASLDRRRNRALIWWEPKGVKPGAVELLDLIDEKKRGLTADRRALAAHAWHPSGRQVALSMYRPDASGGGTACVVAVFDREAQAVSTIRTRSPVLWLAFTPDGEQLVCCESRRILWRSVESGEESHRVEHRAVWFEFLDRDTAISHDGRQVTFWNAASRQPGDAVDLGEPEPEPQKGVGPLFRRHPIVATALSPRRDQLAIATRSTLRIYGIAR